jgi:hypothetical protein
MTAFGSHCQNSTRSPPNRLRAGFCGHSLLLFRWAAFACQMTGDVSRADCS